MQRTFSQVIQFLTSKINLIKISGTEGFLLIGLLVLGCTTILLIPIGGGYDEDQHLLRVWQLSDFVLVPREMSAKNAKFPEIFFELSYRRQPLVEPIAPDFWKRNAGFRLYDKGYHYGVTSTRSVYSPALLLPQAMTMRYLGRKYDLPVLIVYYGCRLAGLLSYTILVWLALRLMPYSKWLFLLLCLTPGAIYQAASISADSISNGIGFLFIAGCLALHEREEMLWKDMGFLVLLISILFMSKINLAPLALLPFSLIPPRRYKDRFAYPLLIVFSIILFTVEIIGWNMLASSNIRFIAREGISFSGQLQHILSNPLLFLQVMINSLVMYGRGYILQWIGVYGYDYGNVPSLTYVLFLLSLGLALLQGTNERQPDKRTRVVLIIFFLLTYLATVSLFYFTITAVGEKFVYGVQGRYFIPTVPLLFLALSGLFAVRKFTTGPILQGALYLAASSIYIAGLYFSFHVICGSTYYNQGLCYQPFYKNYSPLSRSTSPISDGTILVQEIVPVCNGLTLIQARINSVGADVGGKTEFIIRDEKQNRSVIVEIIQNDTLSEDSWHVINFQPDWNSAGKLYTLTIRGIGGSLNSGPLLAYSLRPEYPVGALYENGNAVPDDIIFQYGCITGLEKIRH